MPLRSTLLPAVSIAALAALVQMAVAEADADEVVLTVTEAGVHKVFEREDLARLRQVTYETSTIWTEGVLQFRGVPLSEVLKAAGFAGRTLVLSASNDYVVEVPVGAVMPDVPLIAFELDGKPMSLREKGPLWLVYPYDLSTVYQTEVIYTRSIWQLDRIEVQP